MCVIVMVSFAYHLEGHVGSSIPDGLAWRRSSRCNGGNCIEVVEYDGLIMVRSSADPDGPKLAVSRDQWRVWIVSLKDGFFDRF